MSVILTPERPTRQKGGKYPKGHKTRPEPVSSGNSGCPATPNAASPQSLSRCEASRTPLKPTNHKSRTPDHRDRQPPVLFSLVKQRSKNGGSQHNTPRKLAGNRPDYGQRLYSGQSRLAEQGNAGKAVRTRRVFGKRTGCIWTTWARTPSTVCWPHCGASCSAMTISPRSTVRTMDGTACRPACRTHGHERGTKNGWKACDRRVEVQENVRLRVLR